MSNEAPGRHFFSFLLLLGTSFAYDAVVTEHRNKQKHDKVHL